MRRKFVLIEQSLRDVGGHYFEYAREILHAAQAAGYQPVLATHQEFADAAHLPADCRVLPLFPYGSDKIHRIPSAYSFGLWRQIAASRGNPAAIAARLADAVSDRCKAALSGLRWWRRISRIRGFATACEKLFSQCPLAVGDQVLCSTMSDMDLLGLVRYLSQHPDSTKAAWHLQFHFSVFCGRDPDYPAQDRSVEALRQRMATAIESIPQHRLHFYTTTDELGRQFNRLNVAPFRTLPWPVGRQFHGSHHAQRDDAFRGAKGDNAPLRVLCAGAVRREKGSDQLGALARSLWAGLLQPRKVQLLFQLGSKRRYERLTELPPGSFQPAASIDRLPDSPLVSLPHPLSPDDYARVLKRADIGLLTYNAEVYFARCSGILVELLAAGVPVIVPAGCWLAEQIAAANQQHLDELALQATSLRAQTSRAGELELAVAPGSSHLLLRCWRPLSEPLGSYLRIRTTQFDARGRPAKTSTSIVGCRQVASAPFSALIALEPECAKLQIAISSAYHSAPPPLLKWSADQLAPPAGAARWPAGLVGLTFADLNDIPVLLADIAANHGHYRAGAAAFARTWQAEHAAERTIELLTGRPTISAAA